MFAYLLLGLLLPACLALDTTSCGSTKSCVAYPSGCVPTSPSCLYFTYAWNSSTSSLTMELSGGSGANSYVAVGFAPAAQMQNADVYYCTGTALKSAYIGTRYSDPVVDGSLPSGVATISSSVNGGVAECSFTRPASVTKDSTQVFDLSSTAYHILLAAGSINPGTSALERHSDRWPSSSSFNFTAPPAPSSPTTPSNTNGNAAAGCGTTKGCFRVPSGCTPGASGCFFAAWTYMKSTDLFKIEVVGQPNAEYAAVAFGTVDRMQDADLYYCTASSLLSGAIRELRQQPATDSSLPTGITGVTTSVNNGVITCSFQRIPSISKTITSGSHAFNLVTNNYYVLLAVGPLAGGQVGLHSARQISAGAQNFTATSEAGAGGSMRQNMIKAHASLMLIAWMTCVSIGVLFARHFKPLFHDQTCFKEKVWFQLHRSLMITALLATVIGFILIFVAQEGFSQNAGAHPYIGIVVTILAIINPVMALFRPHPGTPNRYIFNWGHWFVGSAARILGISAIFLGVDLSALNLPEWDTWVLVGFVCFHVVTEIIMEIISAVYGHIDAYKRQNFEGVDDKVKPPPKGAAIKYFVMILYSLGNLAFLFTFIVAIGQY